MVVDDRLLIDSDLPTEAPIILLDVQYERYFDNGDELAEIILYTRENGQRNRYRVRNFLPYFYANLTIDALEELKRSQPVLSDWLLDYSVESRVVYHSGKRIEVLKLRGKQPWKVPTIRDVLRSQGFDVFEADIPFTHRFMIDHDLKGLQELKFEDNQFHSVELSYIPQVCSLDIEIDSAAGDDFEEIMSSFSRRVTAIGYAFGEEDGSLEGIESKCFLLKEDSDDAEREMLEEATTYLWKSIDPDVLISYNGDTFDFVYLVNRLQKLGLSASLLAPYDTNPKPPAFGNGWQLPGVMVFDLYKKTRYIYTPDGRKTLSSVSQEKLGVDKIELEVDHAQLWRASLDSDTERSQFESYLRRDVKLTYKLWFAFGMAQWLEVIKISGGPPGDGMYFTERQAGEFLVFKTMFKNEVMIPPAPSSDEKKIRKRDRISAQGGLVLDPIRDLTEAVLICDFASMYPSIIVAHNIGGESFDPSQKLPRKRFSDDFATSMAIMQKELLEKRFAVKKELVSELPEDELVRLKAYSWGLKIVANSTFGSYNFIGSRLYDTQLASTITEIGRNYLRSISKQVEQFGEGYETIYGDTDSVFIETPLIDKIEQLWESDADNPDPYSISEIPKLLEFLHQNLPAEMSLELEDVAYRILFHRGAKKRYAYVSALSKKISIMGFEAIRNDFSPFARKIQTFAFDILLRSGDLKHSKKKTINYIQSLLDLPEEELKELVTTFGPLRRNPEKYKSPTPAIAAYLHYKMYYKQEISWKDYDFFPFIISKGSSAQKNRARHPDLVSFEEIDLDHYIEEALRSINRFHLNITLDEAKGIEYMDLEDFFSINSDNQ